MVDSDSMGALSFTFVDVLVVAVILVSAGFAFWRGFVLESLSIFAWAAGAFAALYFGPAVVPLLKGVLSGWGAILAAYAGVFLIVVLPLSFISFRFSENVRHSPVQGMDRILGLVFGLARGLVIVGILYLVFSMLVPIPSQPRWMSQARLLPLIQKSSEVILAVIPGQDREGARHRTSRTAARPAPPPERRDAARAAQKRPQKTYGAKDRRALDRLIEATDNGGGK